MKIKKPSSVVVANRSSPVSSDLAWTIAPGTLAPFGSYTFPVSWPEFDLTEGHPGQKGHYDQSSPKRFALVFEKLHKARHLKILHSFPMALSGLPTSLDGTGSVNDPSLNQEVS